MRDDRDQELVDGFWTRIYSICNVKRISVSTLCERLGMPRTYMASSRSRGRSIPIEKAAKIAKSLGVSLDFLITGENAQPGNKPGSIPIPERAYKDPDIYRLVFKLCSLSEVQLKAIDALISTPEDSE